MKIRHFLLALALGVGVFLLPSCGAVPSAETGVPSAEEPAAWPTAENPVAQPTATLSLPAATEAPTAVPSIPEQRRLTLEFPPSIRAGDADVVRLTLEVDDKGNITPTAEIDGHEVTGDTVEIPNLYDTHNILAQARMDMAGVQVLPADVVSEPLLPGEPVSFYWSVRPEDAGEYRGTVWLYLRFTPKTGGDSLTRTLSVQFIEIEATTFLGVKAGPARWLGAIGSFISGILGMPLIDELLKWLWKKITKK